MGDETMDLAELAAYLNRDARDLSKWASRGYLPAQKVGGEWRFHRAEINQWLETQMHAYTEQELMALERGGDTLHKEEPLLTTLMTPAVIAVPLNARTRASVLRELVETAERSGKVYDSAGILEAIRNREDLGTTALPAGIAIPHPRRPMPNAVEESIVAYGKTESGIPFGAENGGLTDIFFLVCCRDERAHLQVLARLSRLFLKPDFIDELRSATTAADTFHLIESAENDLIG
jgi:PTS system nitrogen regulatory IIA component